MLDPRLFRLAGVRSGALGIIVLFFALFGLFFVNAQFLQNVKAYGPLLTGVCILPIAATMPVASARSTRLASRIGTRATTAAGMLIVAAGLFLLSLATADTPYAPYGVVLALVGIGMGLAMPPLSSTIIRALPPKNAGVGSGLNSTARELGSALGVAVFSTVLSSHLGSGAHGKLAQGARDAFTSGMSVGLRIGVALILATTVFVVYQHPKHE